MQGVVSGLLNKQIANDLGISEITVKAHRGELMRRMKVRSVPQLVSVAAALGVGILKGPRRSGMPWVSHPSPV
jgi:FixJ family two-component response regulator